MTAPHTLTTTRAHILALLRLMGHGTVDEIVAASETPIKRTTVASFLQKAHIRGRVARRQEGVAFRYWLSDMPEPPAVVTVPEAEPFVPFVRYQPMQPTGRTATTVPDSARVLWAIACEPGATLLDIAGMLDLPLGTVKAITTILCEGGLIRATLTQGVTCWRIAD